MNLNNLTSSIIDDTKLASFKYKVILKDIIDYQKSLDDNTEVALLLASFGTNITMAVQDLGYQNPDMLYFYGFVDGKDSQLIQHTNQLNFLITSVPKADPDKPARRIGFNHDND